jgi:hypothetical protein
MVKRHRRIIEAVVLFFFTIIAPSVLYGAEDANRTCNGLGDSLHISADIYDQTKLRLTVINCTDSIQKISNGQLRPPFLRLFIVNKFGDPLERFSWIGDRTTARFSIEPGSKKNVIVELDRWFEGLDDLMSSDCLDMLWALRLSPIDSARSYFGGGAAQLTCKSSEGEQPNGRPKRSTREVR